MRVSIISLLMLVCGQGLNEAEKLFQKMEKKLSTAKTLEVFVNGSMEFGERKMKYTGTILLGQDNKAYVKLSGDMIGKPFVNELVSDGSNTMSDEFLSPGGRPAFHRTGKKLRVNLIAVITRGSCLGLNVATKGTVSEKEGELGPDQLFQVSDFKLGANEKLDGKDAQFVDYQLRAFRGREPFSVKLWLDSTTGLPIKRVLKSAKEDGKLQVIETYRVTLDPVIDGKKFKLPKEASPSLERKK